MKSFVFYRMPYAETYVEIEQLDGQPETLQSPLELDGHSGFVVAPFSYSDTEPLILIRPDKVTTADVPHAEGEPGEDCCLDIDANVKERERKDYAIDFSNYHSRLECGDFQKIVLARSTELPRKGEVDLKNLFFKACNEYPRVFVALVSTPVCGTWLVATPEILLEGDGTQWHTMALAGTMTLGNLRWTEKNVCEQAYVTSYITDCIEQFTSDFTVEGPYSVRAGQLVHLRTDFRFTTSKAGLLGHLVTALHPTPAVCGIPKRETHDFIVANEHYPRSYYSGFMGPLAINGFTHLYVSLRCMKITPQAFRLYAGGGILTESVEQQEWEETEEKMKTMKKLIYVLRQR